MMTTSPTSPKLPPHTPGLYPSYQGSETKKNPSSESTSPSEKATSAVGQKYFEGFGKALSNIRNFLIGSLIGRISPRQEKNLHSKEDQKTLEAIEQETAKLDQLQDEIKALKATIGEKRRNFETAKAEIEQPKREKELQTQIKAKKSALKACRKELAVQLAALLEQGEKATPDYGGILEARNTLFETEKKLAGELLELQGQSVLGPLTNQYNLEKGKLISDLYAFRTKWQKQKQLVEAFKAKSLPAALKYSSQLRRLNQAEQKINTIFKSHHRALNPIDYREFAYVRLFIQQEVTVLVGVDHNLHEIYDSSVNIKEALTALDQLKELAQIAGNKNLANEIESYCKQMRVGPLLSSDSIQTAAEQLERLHEKENEKKHREDLAIKQQDQSTGSK